MQQVGVISKIAVIEELETYGVPYEYAGEDELRVWCPIHERDQQKGGHTKSAYVSISKKQWCCRSAECSVGRKGGDVVTLVCLWTGMQRADVIYEMSKRYGVADDKLISPDIIEKAHRSIWDAAPLLKELHERAVTNELIRKYRLGAGEGRVFIPIDNEDGFWVNICKYAPGKKGRDKMKSVRGHGSPRIWPPRQMAYDTVMLCGGQMKAIVAAEQLNPHGIGCVCITTGEGLNNKAMMLVPKFAGKRMLVCMDIDKAGQVGAEDACRSLFNVAESVKLPVVLPLDPKEYPTGDINDFVYWEKGDLWPVIKEVLEGADWVPEQARLLRDEEPVPMDLTRAIHADAMGQRFLVKATVSMLDTAPYPVPKKVMVRCDKHQPWCAICPVYAMLDPSIEIEPEHPALLQMVETSLKGLDSGLRDATGVPRKCAVASFDIVSSYNVEDARVSPPVEITSRSNDRVMQPAYCIGQGLEANETYELVGRMYPHPASQRSTLLISKYKATQDALATFQLRDPERFELFKPSEWTVDGVQGALDKVYTDFEANVTRIRQRRDIHLAVDLMYHSPLNIQFDGALENGWVQGLVLGDSGHGKSAISCGSRGPGGLMAHYRLGEKVDMRNATPAGLLGGLVSNGSRWFVSWGLLPQHDKRALILEELKGAHQSVLQKLTDCRSSGYAKLDKIEKKQTKARCRLLVNSNTFSGRAMHTYSHGIGAVTELIPGMEDVRRFDYVVLVSAEDVDENVINSQERPIVEHVYTGELCRQLVLWAWTREPNQVVFDEKATSLVLAEATRLSGKFTDEIPIFDRGSGRIKIAKLAASLAARTFSCDASDTIRVRECHVQYITSWLDRMYSSKLYGYAEYTASQRATQMITEPGEVKAYIESLPFPLDFVRSISRVDRIELSDLQDWTGWDRPEAMQLMSFLVRKHALSRDGRAYRKTVSFNVLLNKCLEPNGLTDRPAHLKEKEY